MTPPDRQLYDREHRRETLLYFILPSIVAVVTLLAVIVVVLLLKRQMQVAIIADWLLSVFVLCPALLCGFVVCILLIILVALMNRLQDAILRPVRWADEKSQNAANRFEAITTMITEKMIDFASNFAFLDRLLSFFDEPAGEVKKEENDAGNST